MSGSGPARETIGTDEQAEPVGTGEIFETSAEFDWDHPENDPSHPRYEPPHLRHRPGDTWQIGGKPFDIDDPGPYGNPLWRPDRRTGRHRRGELPDPLPPEPEPEPEPTPSPITDPRPSPPVADPRPSPPPVANPRPSPGPRRRGFWTETNHKSQGRSGPLETAHQQFQDPTDLKRRRLETESDHPEQDGGYRFDRLREDAWDHFMTDSAPLAAAHTVDRPRRRTTTFEREAGLAWGLWIWLWRVLVSLLSSDRQESGQRRSLRSPGPVGSGAEPEVVPDPGVDRAPGAVPVSEASTGPGGSGSTDRNPKGPQVVEEAAEPLIPHARGGTSARTSSMARAIAGAQRARAQQPRAQLARTEVAAWA